MAFLAGQKVSAADLNALSPPTSVTAGSSGYANTTSTSYGTLSGDPGVAFTAPASGKVDVHIRAAMVGEAAGIGSQASFIVRTGSSVGSGTTVVAAADDNSIGMIGTDDVEAGQSTLVTGLTPGNSYNVQMVYKRRGASSAGGFARRRITVKPTF
jgi:hypothetical protein